MGWIAYSSQIPPDSELVAFFGERKPAFIALRDLLLEEPPRIIGFTRTEVMVEETWRRFSPGNAGMSLDRFERIQKLMASNSVKEVWRNEKEFIVKAGYAGGGFLNKGPRLAYVYRNDSPLLQVESLNQRGGVKRKPYASGYTVIYRPLGEGWFIRLVL